MEDPYSSSDSGEDYEFSGRERRGYSPLARYLGCAAVVALAASCVLLFVSFGMHGSSSPSGESLSTGPGTGTVFTKATPAPTSPPIAERVRSDTDVMQVGGPEVAVGTPVPIAERVSTDTSVMQVVDPLAASGIPAPFAEHTKTDVGEAVAPVTGRPAATLAAADDGLAGGCFLNHTYYTEVSGKHSMMMGERTKEVSPQACQLRCANTAGCAHFSFWSDGGCLLTSYTAYQERYTGPEANVIAGPSDCASVMLETAGPTVDLKAALNLPPFVAQEATGCGSLRSRYDLSWKAAGSAFFDEFQFSTLSETHGAEWYVNKTEAFRLGLVETTDTNAVIRVGNQIMPFKRRSVMLRSARAWQPATGFVLAMKYKHVPYGAGIWPAFWLMNSDYLWPKGGELDILEYANDAESKVTFHTNKNCSLAAEKLDACMKGPNVDQEVIRSCYTNYTANDLGCKPPQIRRTGKWFAENPGVIATVWDESGVSVFHIPEAEVPPDLNADAPNPNTWERWLIAYLPFDPQSCFDIAKPQEIVLNIALCGDWAGGAWYSSEEARSTGFLPPYCIPGHVSEPATDCCTIFISSPTAEEYLKKRAFFDIEYIKVFEPIGNGKSMLSSGSYRNNGVPLEEPCVPCGEPRWIPKGSLSRANVCCESCSNATYYWNDVCNCGGTLVCKAVEP